jgi:hypothetical protein
MPPLRTGVASMMPKNNHQRMKIIALAVALIVLDIT